MGFFSKLKEGLTKTRKSLTEKIEKVIIGYADIDDDLLDELELHVLDMYYSDGIKINGVLKNKWLIRKALLRLNSIHIQYIVDSYKKAAQNSKINHIRGYIQAMLYNCAHESELKVLSDVEYDLNNS